MTSQQEKRERRTHFRGKPRPGRRIEVEYQIGEAAAVTAFTRDIGVGGAFIVTSSPSPPGTPLTLKLHVPNTAETIEVHAEVRWTSAAAEAPGMGVRFHPLEVEQLLQLNEYFASLTGRDE